jgi:uncharacterized protein (TIGR00304 family)
MTDLAMVGLAIILAGFLVVLLATVGSSRRPAEREDAPRSKGGGFVLIGPIPIMFGSNWKLAGLAVVVGLVLMVVIFLLTGVLIL